ncbi:MAG TPA: NAD-dependent deacylase [Candidatus Eisenbacteria bacterium]|nr:NAD-dependent deacylase [Candidatus Eisenbacteria bacterium]
MHRLSPNDHVFVLTGAGVSAESGLPTFRGMNGLWRGYRVEEVATPEAFAADPALVWQFYSERRQRHQTVQPNPAHVALAELERALGDRLFLCTQNVDSLHEQAGSERVVHMHGRILQSRCSNPRCTTLPFDDRRLYRTREEVPQCNTCGALVRPHICWFGEVPFEMDLILHQLDSATLLLTVGTSGVVEPAASFVRMARQNRTRTIYIGPEEPSNSVYFDEVLLGKAGEVLPELVRELISE